MQRVALFGEKGVVEATKPEERRYSQLTFREVDQVAKKTKMWSTTSADVRDRLRHQIDAVGIRMSNCYSVTDMTKDWQRNRPEVAFGWPFYQSKALEVPYRSYAGLEPLGIRAKRKTHLALTDHLPTSLLEFNKA